MEKLNQTILSVADYIQKNMDKVAKGVDANKLIHVKRFAAQKLFNSEINQLLAYYFA